MVESLYCTRILPSRQYFPWYYKIKRQLNDIQQRYVDLHEKIYLKSPVTTTEDNCFTVCRQRTTRSSTVFNTAIEHEFVPNDDAEKLKVQTITSDGSFNKVNDGDVLVIPLEMAKHFLRYKINQQIIIVVNDVKEQKYAKKLIHNCCCVKVSYLNDLKKVASFTLEESMFKPMKFYAERLDDILQVNLKHQTGKDQMVSKRKMKTKHRKVPYYSNKELGQNKKVNMNKSKHIDEKIKLHADNIHRWKDSSERLYNEIIGMFNRSRLQEQNKPKIRVAFQNRVDDEVSNQLYKIGRSVKSCGYRYGTLQVFVDGIHNDKINSAIKDVLKSHNIFDFKIVPAICTYKSFLGVGAKVCPNKGVTPYGSLGGFAKKNSHGMCALISRHVAIHSQDKKVSFISGKRSIQSNIISETVPIDSTEPILDISATEILASDVSKCDTKFKSEEGVPTTGKDCIYDETQLTSRRVHLWGAVSSPGLGIITMPEIRDRNSNEDNAYVIVENRDNSTTVMCKEGDSGAMVCADDDYGSGVEVISMLMGEDTKNPGKYATLRIDKGLKQLEKQTDSSFRLCKD